MLNNISEKKIISPLCFFQKKEIKKTFYFSILLNNSTNIAHQKENIQMTSRISIER